MAFAIVNVPDPHNWLVGGCLILVALGSAALFDVNYEPTGMTADELRKGMRWLTRGTVQRPGDRRVAAKTLRASAGAAAGSYSFYLTAIRKYANIRSCRRRGSSYSGRLTGRARF